LIIDNENALTPGHAEPAVDVHSLFENEIPIRAELARRSLHYFLREFWHTISNDPFHDNWHIELLCDELEKIFHQVHNREPHDYDLIINVPPGTTKSTIVMRMFPVWCWVNDFHLSFITGTYAASLALSLADDSRDIINSELFTAFYPDLQIRHDRDSKGDYQIAKRYNNKWHHGGSRYSTSSGSTITGVHGHIILIDDPIDPQHANATSELTRNTVNDWMDQTIPMRKADKAITPIVLIMQRLHENDPAGHMLAKKNARIKHINLPGEIIENDQDIFVKPKRWAKYYENGLLDPVRLSRRALNDAMTYLGQYGYAGQILQSPKPPGKGMFNTDALHFIDKAPGRDAIARAIFYWDKAGTKGAGAFTAGVHMVRLRRARGKYKYVITRVRRGQWAAPEREEIIRAECASAGPGTIVYVEQEPGSGGKESAEATVRNLKRIGVKAKAESPQGNKVSRADPLSVAVARGEVAIVNGPWMNEYLNEMRLFPLSKYMDQIDASSGAYNRLLKIRLAGAW
jgi:predicted phage terminase large subunit-like protein